MQFLRKMFQGRNGEMPLFGAICVIALLAVAIYIHSKPPSIPNESVPHEPTHTPELVHIPKALLGWFTYEHIGWADGRPFIIIPGTEYQRDSKNPPVRLHTEIQVEGSTMFIDIQGYFTSDRGSFNNRTQIYFEDIETLDTVVIRLFGEENRYRIAMRKYDVGGRRTDRYSMEPIKVSNVFIDDTSFQPFQGGDIDVTPSFCAPQYRGHRCTEYEHRIENHPEDILRRG